MMKNVVKEYFDTLNNANLPYCILRGYQTLPDTIENDLDFGVLPEGKDEFVALTISFLTKKGFVLVNKMNKYKYTQIYFIDAKGQQFIHIDVWSGFQLKGKTYLDVYELIETRKTFNGFYIPSEHYELALSFLKEYLHNAKIRKDKIKHLQTLVGENFETPFQKYFKSSDVELFKNWIIQNETDVKSAHSRIVSDIRSEGSFLKTWSNKISFFFTELKLTFGKKGLFVVLVGPDGSGKTTTYNMLDKEISKKYFSGTSYFHFNFEILPSLSRLMGKKEREREAPEDDDGQAKTKEEPAPSYIKKMIYVLYYLFDFFLGNFKIRQLRYRNKLIVFDRYYYDYFIHGDYTNIPRFLKYFYKWLAPKPDIFFYLKAKPENIFERKPELSVIDITKQQAEIEKLINRNKGIASDFFEVETDRGLESVKTQLSDKIAKTLSKRYD